MRIWNNKKNYSKNVNIIRKSINNTHLNEHLEKNDMLNIKTIYLPAEENYNFPSSDGHKLSKSCLK